MKTTGQIKIEPGTIEIKQEYVAPENSNDQFENSSNLVSNIPLASSKFKLEPEFNDDKDIKLKIESDRSVDELSDDEFIETCIKVEKQTKHGYKICDITNDGPFLYREYAKDSNKKYNDVKVEEDQEFDDDNNVNFKSYLGVKEDVGVEENIDFNEDIAFEDIKTDGNIKLEKEIKTEEDIDVVDHEVGLEINESCSDNNNKERKGYSSNKSNTGFSCSHCTYETPTLHTLIKHLKLHENPCKVAVYYCTKCSYKTRQKGHLKRHDSVHQTNNDDVLCFRCGICDFMTKQRATLKRHIGSVHWKIQRDQKSGISETEIFRCGKCSYATYTRGLLVAHMDKHKDTRDVNSLYICDVCSFSTKYRRNLRVHLETHKESPELQNNQCKICNFKTRLPYCLKRHLLSRKHLLAVGKIEQYCPRILKS